MSGGAVSKTTQGGGLVALLLVTSLLTMLNSASFPALVPVLQHEWGLNNTEAGLISGIFYGGYICAVPFTVSMTDHVDARRIYLFALVLTGIAGIAFAVFAEGFWSALIARALAGAGMAGTYMPGLRLITDRTAPERQSRWIALYTANYALGISISFVATIELSARVGWHGAILCASGAALLCVLLILPVPRHVHMVSSGKRIHLPDLRPVLRNRPALRYIGLYGLHNWELFAFQSWIVAYLTWCGVEAELGGDWTSWVSWLTAMFLVGGTVASVGTAELASRFGRPRVIRITMTLAIAAALLAGAGAHWPIAVTVAACLVFSMLTMADSAAITTGAMFAAPEGQRGATLAVHSIVGFSGGLLGPFVVGGVLDFSTAAFGQVNWLAGFFTMALGSLAGLFLLGRGRRIFETQ
jgi:MFS family permease